MPFSSIDEMQAYALKEQAEIKAEIKEAILRDIANKQPKLPILFEVTSKFDNPKDLYFIRQKGTNIYKIGISNNPENRLMALETSNPNELELFLVIKNGGYLEFDFHVFFSPFKIKNEWFEITIENILQCVVKSITSDFEGSISTKYVTDLERKIHLLEYEISQYRAMILDEEDDELLPYY